VTTFLTIFSQTDLLNPMVLNVVYF